MDFEIYKDTLGKRNHMDPLAYRAYGVWQKQRARCYNKNSPDYCRYGGKGIKVEYSSREFIGWYLMHVGDRPPLMRDVGRIDHSKNYCFKNIRIESRSENSREVISRLGTPRPPKAVIVSDIKTGKLIFVSKSIEDAAAILGMHKGNVSWHCRTGKPHKRRGIKIDFVHGGDLWRSGKLV